MVIFRGVKKSGINFCDEGGGSLTEGVHNKTVILAKTAKS